MTLAAEVDADNTGMCAGDHESAPTTTPRDQRYTRVSGCRFRVHIGKHSVGRPGGIKEGPGPGAASYQVNPSETALPPPSHTACNSVPSTLPCSPICTRKRQPKSRVYRRVRLPVALVDFLEDALPVEMARDRVRDRLLYLVALVTDRVHCRESDDYYRPLYSQTLDRVVGEIDGRAAYADLLDALQHAQVIEVFKHEGRESYDTGRHASKRYRCSWRGWLTARRRVYHLETMRVGERSRKSTKGGDIEASVLGYLEQCWRRVSFDVPGALATVLRLVDVDPTAGETGGTDSDYARLSALCEASPRAQAALEAVWRTWVAPDDTDEVFVRDTYGRVHTPVTNMWSALRSSLRIDGDNDLWSIDLRASQLVFAVRWMLTAGPWMHQPGQPLPADWSRWIDLVQSDVCPYRETYRLCRGRLPTNDERAAWKAEFFEGWWYATAWWQDNSPIGQVLAREFPSVHRFIHARKVSSEGHAAFPVQLQRFESSCMIDDLVSRLREANVCALTVHDSLIVRGVDRDRALECMRASLDAVLGGVRYEVKVERVAEAAAASFDRTRAREIGKGL